MKYLKSSSEEEKMEVIVINIGFFTMDGGQGFPGSQGQRGFSGFGGQGQNSQGFPGFSGAQGQGFPGGQRQTFNFSGNQGRSPGSTGNINPEAFKDFFKKTQKQK